MNHKTVLAALVLMVMAMSAVSCVQPDGEPREDASPSAAASVDPTPTEEPSDDVLSDEDRTLRATIDSEFGQGLLIGYYTDDTSNDQCIDLTGASPVEQDCSALSLIDDCGAVFLGEGGPMAVLCDIEGDGWGVDLGYEGAYTTADGQRGEFGFSCRVAVFDGSGECTAETGGESVTYDPTLVQVGDYIGLALAGSPDPSDALETAIGELRATTGLEAVIRSTVVFYADDEERNADEPDLAAYAGLNAFTSLDQNAKIADGLLAQVPGQFLLLDF